MAKMATGPIPLSKRPLDIILILFFCGALFFVYMADYEQLAIKNYAEFKVSKKYPVFPPKFMVDAIHWWGESFDPLVLARPTWYDVTIWWDILFFGLYYPFAIYAFTFGKEWIRVPSLIYSSVICILVSMIMTEQLFNKAYASTNFNIVIPVYAQFIFFPLYVMYRAFPSKMFSNDTVEEGKVETIPISKRPLDIFIVFFFVIALVVVYTMDCEQVTIANYEEYKLTKQLPFWPPKFVVEASHWWGENFDPLLLERPYWFKAAVWIDVIYFGPYYLCAIYAFIVGREWIRAPSIIFASIICTNLSVIFYEHVFGHAIQPNMPVLVLVYIAWLAVPLLVLWRSMSARMFTRVVEGKKTK